MSQTHGGFLLGTRATSAAASSGRSQALRWRGSEPPGDDSGRGDSSLLWGLSPAHHALGAGSAHGEAATATRVPVSASRGSHVPGIAPVQHQHHSRGNHAHHPGGHHRAVSAVPNTYSAAPNGGANRGAGGLFSSAGGNSSMFGSAAVPVAAALASASAPSNPFARPFVSTTGGTAAAPPSAAPAAFGVGGLFVGGSMWAHTPQHPVSHSNGGSAAFFRHSDTAPMDHADGAASSTVWYTASSDSTSNSGATWF